jgi:hypothetical protein
MPAEEEAVRALLLAQLQEVLYIRDDVCNTAGDSGAVACVLER